MPVFHYQAINSKGSRIEGSIESKSQDIVVNELRREGLYVSSIRMEKNSFLKKEIQLGKIIKLEELVVFSRQLATLIKAGITILDAVRILADQTENKKFKKVLKQMEADIRSGETFSATLNAHPRAFPPIFTNMVKAGETAGNLDDTLNQVAIFFEKESNTRKKVKSALTYPIVVGILSIVVTIFMLVKIVPGFVQMYADFGAELPLPTRIVMGVSNFFVDSWYIVIVLFLLMTIGVAYFGKTPKGSYYLDYAKLKIPVFGKLIQKSAMARFSRTLSSLLSSAVPILQALTMVSQVVGNEAIAKPIRDSRDSLRQGNTIHEPLEKHWVFPPLLTHMMAIGEETGSIEEMLMKVADFYESDVETMTDQLKSLIEPLMVVFLAIVVGTIILAVLTPMFGIYDMIGQ